MLSNRTKHTEASSQVPTGADTDKPHALWNLRADQSVSANMSPTAMSHSSVSLMESIVDPINLEKAWKKVRSNGGTPGPDAMTIKAFPKHFREYWPAIRQQLMESTYQPAPTRRKSISKPDGGQRDLGIHNIQERLIQQAILKILTQILANILLDDFDKDLGNRGLLFVRYADDFFMFTKTSQAAVRVARSIEQYLTRQLKLVVNHQKSRICKTSEVDFLGFSFTGYSGQLRVSPKNLKKFKDRTREITRRNRGVSIKHRLLELRRFFQGWVGFFKIVPLKSFFRDLDKWARRRLRSCYWKQWRGPRTRIANLKKLGVRNREAITHGVSSKGP